MKQFMSHWNSDHWVCAFREAEYCRFNSTVILKGTIEDSERIEQLLSTWNELCKFKKCIDLDNTKINEMLSVDEGVKETVRNKLRKVTRILGAQFKSVKRISSFADPKNDDFSDDFDPLEDIF